MNTNFTKAELRKELLARRKSLNPNDVATRSRLLVDKLASEFHEANIIHCFQPLADDNEPDLREFIEEMIRQNKIVYTSEPVSRTVRKINNLDLNQFQLGDNIEFDLVIVPMLGFSGLHRLGFGGGFYDRFLSAQPQAQKIGVCFREFEINKLPTETHDIALDEIISI